MRVATVTFDRCDSPAEWSVTDICGLQEVVMTAMDRHFDGYAAAAEAQKAYRRVVMEIENDPSMTLFGAEEALRAGLAAHPDALEWSAFETEAAASIAPFCFSIRFTG